MRTDIYSHYLRCMCAFVICGRIILGTALILLGIQEEEREEFIDELL
ncbi:MAG: hypothetical protein P4L69_21500 [Desulfosporosinus sp.]|nr:hypothetical protein [Desulfosporosinus sp.]